MPPSHEAESSRAPHQWQAREAQGEMPQHVGMQKKTRRRSAVGAIGSGATLLATGTPAVVAAPFPVTPPKKYAAEHYDQLDILPPRDRIQPPDGKKRIASTSYTRQDSQDSDEEARLAEDLQHIEDLWKAGRFETFIDSNSHNGGQALGTSLLDGKNISDTGKLEKGKGRAREPTSPYVYNLDALHDVPLRKAERTRSTMRLTSQRSPFHSSEVGRLASNSPNPPSVGLFRPDYPFVPSGRKRPKPSIYTLSGQASNYDYRISAAQPGSLYTLPPDVTEGNVFKHGWTSSQLDDDARLSVPDELRRPRRDSALATAKKLAGVQWYRWKVGEGYVLSTRKDYSAYKEGPGIALSQLLPPREHPYTSSLPLIPNDAKRDLVFMIVSCIVLVAIMTLASEIRALWRSNRKGKRRQINIPMIRILHDDRAQSASSSLANTSIGLRSRQRSKARSIREMCKAALDSPLNRMRSRMDPTIATQKHAVGKPVRHAKAESQPKLDLHRKPSLLSHRSLSSALLGSDTPRKGTRSSRSKQRSSAESDKDEVKESMLEDGILCRTASLPIESASGRGDGSRVAMRGQDGESTGAQLVFASSYDSAGHMSNDVSHGATHSSLAESRSSGSSSSSGSSNDAYTHMDNDFKVHVHGQYWTATALDPFRP